MGEYMEIYIDWTDAAGVDVTAGLKERDGSQRSVRLSHRNAMVRLHPDEVVRAMLIVAAKNMQNGVLDPPGADKIRRYLDGGG